VLKLSRMIDYGVVILSQMTNQRDGLVTAPELAEATGLPAPMVSKVLKSLARSDLVSSHRGVRGGYALTRMPEDISVASIVEALEGPVALTACVEASDSHCRVESLCPIRGGWEKVNDAIREALEAVSLADLIYSGFENMAALEAGSPTETRGQV
jgi:FeS assembly SUF system regulator